MLQDSLLDPSSRVSQSHTNGLRSSVMLHGEVWTPGPMKTEPTGHPEMLVTNHQPTMHTIPGQ